jgi:hypothetical protein
MGMFCIGGFGSPYSDTLTILRHKSSGVSHQMSALDGDRKLRRHSRIWRKNRMYSRILGFIFEKQSGYCHLCGQSITYRKDTVVSAGNNLRNYYHLECAAKIHILKS